MPGFGQQALQIGGTAAGTALGGPIGGTFGAGIGNMAGRALFPDDTKHGMVPGPAQAGGAGSPALSILQALQQHMQQEEMRKQQALQTILQGAVQMESRR